MTLYNLIHTIGFAALVSVASLSGKSDAFILTLPKNSALSSPPSSMTTATTTPSTRSTGPRHPATTSTTTVTATALSAESSPSISTSDVVAVFGRLADRAYVPPPSDVQGTAASGYEFGVMEAGRPKWLCTYEERSGQTQGGGKMMEHVPNWKGYLFGDGGEGGGVLGGKEALRTAMGGECVKFQMPLAAPSGAQIKKDAAEPPTSDAVVDTLWTLLGGGSDGALTAGDVSSALRSTASSNGSSTEDHLTYAVFEKAFMAVVADAL